VSAHRKHCPQANGIISLGVKKALKMASRITDVESQFDNFCWDTLVKVS